MGGVTSIALIESYMNDQIILNTLINVKNTNIDIDITLCTSIYVIVTNTNTNTDIDTYITVTYGTNLTDPPTPATNRVPNGHKSIYNLTSSGYVPIIIQLT
jgi:hypothetical protein